MFKKQFKNREMMVTMKWQKKKIIGILFNLMF